MTSSHALGMSASYDDTLSGATKELSVAKNPDQVQVIVQSLTKSTRECARPQSAPTG